MASVFSMLTLQFKLERKQKPDSCFTIDLETVLGSPMLVRLQSNVSRVHVLMVIEHGKGHPRLCEEAWSSFGVTDHYCKIYLCHFYVHSIEQRSGKTLIRSVHNTSVLQSPNSKCNCHPRRGYYGSSGHHIAREHRLTRKRDVDLLAGVQQRFEARMRFVESTRCLFGHYIQAYSPDFPCSPGRGRVLAMSAASKCQKENE